MVPFSISVHNERRGSAAGCSEPKVSASLASWVCRELKTALRLTHVRVHGVLVEVAKHLHPRLHRARLRILLRIEAPIRLGDRLSSVRGEIIPEVLEVDALATLHQCKWSRTVEVEMPEVLQQEEVGRVA